MKAVHEAIAVLLFGLGSLILALQLAVWLLGAAVMAEAAAGHAVSYEAKYLRGTVNTKEGESVPATLKIWRYNGVESHQALQFELRRLLKVLYSDRAHLDVNKVFNSSVGTWEAFWSKYDIPGPWYTRSRRATAARGEATTDMTRDEYQLSLDATLGMLLCLGVSRHTHGNRNVSALTTCRHPSCCCCCRCRC